MAGLFRRLIYCLLLCPNISYGQIYGEFGTALDHPYEKQYSDVKHAEFGYLNDTNKFAWEVGIGGWTDITKNGTANSEYISLQAGLRTKREGWGLTYLIGPAILTNTDSLLGSNFQVEHSLMLMLVDSRMVAIGVVGHHWSDAGLNKNNYGRNSIGLRAEF